jgi:glycerol-3-phosphate acyltransferase PlsY
MDQWLLWTLLGFIAGSIPFSVLVGRVFLKTDIRRFGDGNPGGTNAWKAGGWKTGVLATFLDMLKGYLPVMLAIHFGVSQWSLVPVTLAPILGHAFSPFLKFRGGKALAATGGAWVALIGVKALGLYLLLTLPVLALQTEDAVASNAGLVSVLAFLIIFNHSPYLIIACFLNIALVAWKHRKGFRHPIHLRPWISKLFGNNNA